MKKYLASVGNAQLLGKVNGVFQHIADIRTLTESSLSFSSTMEEIRAGEGAKLYGRFSHDSGMTVTLTDAMFDMNYISLQIGASIEGNATAFYSDLKTGAVSTGLITLDTAHPVAKIGNACGLDKYVVWTKLKGCDESEGWKATVYDTAPSTISSTDWAGKEVCIRYFVSKPEARQISVSGNFIPAECVLFLTTKLFAGDANAPETGKAIGFITIKVPRFQLDGQFDLSMAMSSAATMSLNGTALAVEDGTCDGNGIYAEIVEVTEDSHCIDDLKDIAVDPENTSVIYGLYTDGHTSTLISNATSTDTTIESWTSGDDTYYVKAKVEIASTTATGTVTYLKGSTTIKTWTDTATIG